jgi:hypothetical protein
MRFLVSQNFRNHWFIAQARTRAHTRVAVIGRFRKPTETGNLASALTERTKANQMKPLEM